jgi:hypothetical protein
MKVFIVDECLHRRMSASLNVCIAECLHRQMSASPNVCIDKCLHWWMSALMNVCITECLHKWMSASLNVCIDECLHWWMSSSLDVRIDECLPHQCLAKISCSIFRWQIWSRLPYETLVLGFYKTFPLAHLIRFCSELLKIFVWNKDFWWLSRFGMKSKFTV